MSPGLITPTFSIFIFPVTSLVPRAADGRPAKATVVAATPAWTNRRRSCCAASFGFMTNPAELTVEPGSLTGFWIGLSVLHFVVGVFVLEVNVTRTYLKINGCCRSAIKVE